MFLNDRSLRIADEVVTMAQELGHSPSQVALSWLRHQPGIIIPILGARTLTHLQDNLGCLGVQLPAQHVRRLTEISQPTLGFPHDFLASAEVQDVVYGGMRAAIINHRA